MNDIKVTRFGIELTIPTSAHLKVLMMLGHLRVQLEEGEITSKEHRIQFSSIIKDVGKEMSMASMPQGYDYPRIFESLCRAAARVKAYV